MISTPNGTTQSPTLESTPASYTPEDIDRLTRLGVVLPWEDLDYEDHLDLILGNPQLSAWATPEVIDTLCSFRRIPRTWMLIKARYKEYGGFPRDLERDIDTILQTEQATPEGADGQAPQPTGPQAVLIQADTVVKETIAHLWQPYIPRKMATILDGDPGVGKTGTACVIAAAVTRGWSLPEASGPPSASQDEPGHVLMVAMEDNLGAVIVPRLEQCGADLSRVTFVNEITDEAGQPRPFTLADLPLLTAYLERVRPRFVYIDAIQAVLGAKVDIHRANQVTAILGPLKTLAEQYDCAVLCSRHPAKPGQHVAKVLYRGMGSQAFVGTVRSGLFVEEHPSDPTKFLLVHYKANTGQLGQTIIFSKAHGQFEWVGASRITHRTLAGDGASGPLPQLKLKAALWLETKLANSRLPASALFQQGEEEHDFSKKVLRAAADCLGVTKIQVLGDFLWSLPPFAPLRFSTGISGRTRAIGRTGATGVDWPILEETDISGVKAQASQDTPDDPDTPDIPLHPVLHEPGVDAGVNSFPEGNLSPSEGEPCQAPPELACPKCHCLSLIVLGDYGRCPLCQWKGKLTSSAPGETAAPAPQARDWCPGGKSLAPAAPCLHEHVNVLGYCNECGGLIEEELNDL